jgi:hypothetical protein
MRYDSIGLIGPIHNNEPWARVPIFDRHTRPRNQPKCEKSYVDKKEWTDPNTDIATARYARLHTMW